MYICAYISKVKLATVVEGDLKALLLLLSLDYSTLP